MKRWCSGARTTGHKDSGPYAAGVGLAVRALAGGLTGPRWWRRSLPLGALGHSAPGGVLGVEGAWDRGSHRPLLPQQ